MKTSRIYYLALVLLLAFTIQAQPVIIKSIDPDDFPEIKVQFFDRNPEEKKASSYALLENATQVKSELKRLKDSIRGGKDILILFENSVWPEYAAPRNYFKKILKAALSSSLKKGDRLFLATFDWTRPSDGKVLEILEHNGSDDIQAIQSLIDEIEAPSANSRMHHSTELYQAMSEGVQFLKGKRGANAPAIFVLSAEFSNIFNDKYDDAELITDARKADIPIYALRYPLMNAKYNLQKVTHDTYGTHTDVDGTRNGDGIQKLEEMLGSVISRCNGVFYELSYQTTAKPDGAQHEAELVISGADTTKFSFQSPGLLYWFKKYPWLWAIVAVVFLGCTFLVYFLIRKKSKRRAVEKKEVDAKMERIKQDNAEAIAQQQRDHLMEKKFNEEAIQQNKMMASEKEDMLRRSNRLKVFPRPPTLTNAQSSRFSISTPDFNIGRDASKCQLHLDDSTVSRVHASISFEKGPGLLPSQLEGRFFIWDNGSGNGTFLNGRKIPAINENGFLAAELSNGDIIKMGNVQLVFNL